MDKFTRADTQNMRQSK